MASTNMTIENTRFIFATNFAGDPNADRFNDGRRKCNIVIPTEEMAQALIDIGVKVKTTKPSMDDDGNAYPVEKYVTATLKYDTRTGEKVKYPPKVCLVNVNGVPIELTEETVGMLDGIRVKNVNVVLNIFEYNPITHDKSLYIRTLYVEQDLDNDPFMSRYKTNGFMDDMGF